jgi:restriction system protein
MLPGIPAMSSQNSFNKFVIAIARQTAHSQREASQKTKQNYLEQQAAECQARLRYATTVRDRNAILQHFGSVQLDALNTAVHDEIEAIQSILETGLTQDPVFHFDTLKDKSVFVPPPNRIPPSPNRGTFINAVKPLNWVFKLLAPKRRAYADALREAESQYNKAVVEHENVVWTYDEQCKKAKLAFQERVRNRNEEVSQFEASYKSGDQDAISAYCSLVLENSVYPDAFPAHSRVAFVPESRQVVVDYELPTIKAVPRIASYKYVKAHNNFEAKERKPTEIKDDYQQIVAAIALRTLWELFASDQAGHINVAVFSGYVDTVDPATGKDIRLYLISVRCSKEEFLQLDLNRVDKKACLRNLGAQVSPKPTELIAIKPIVEFEMVDKRFVDNIDVISGLDQRPNLMDLNPHEFEALVSNLFSKMGLETKLTRSTKDGGVDAVAYDKRPVLGGKVVIQAKRYRHTVGVSAVRDLYGTMMNEGANKGILVTTAGYGPDAFEFAKDKPIELIEGGGLLYLLEQVGTRARIVFPQDATGAGA